MQLLEEKGVADIQRSKTPEVEGRRPFGPSIPVGVFGELGRFERAALAAVDCVAQQIEFGFLEPRDVSVLVLGKKLALRSLEEFVERVIDPQYVGLFLSFLFDLVDLPAQEKPVVAIDRAF